MIAKVSVRKIKSAKARTQNRERKSVNAKAQNLRPKKELESASSKAPA
jgi:hypothetical protein